jgi:DNA-binding NtrC family response regulator
MDLEEKVRESKFRQDVLYRLNVLNLRIPPLCERNEDIENLAKYFISKYCRKFNKFTPELTAKAIDILKNYRWPGNVRELRNICERLVVFSESGYITEDDLEGLFKNNNKAETIIEQKSTLNVSKELGVTSENDVDAILKLMQSINFNKTEAARILGISRTTLWRRLKEKQ